MSKYFNLAEGDWTDGDHVRPLPFVFAQGRGPIGRVRIDMCHEDRTELVEQGWSIIALAREN